MYFHSEAIKQQVQFVVEQKNKYNWKNLIVLGDGSELRKCMLIRISYREMEEIT